MGKSNLRQLREQLGHTFQDERLLTSALTHRSYLHENQSHDVPDNERLEFLGDSILNYLVAEHLYAHFPDSGEGELTALRAAIVQARTLASFARSISLGDVLLLSKGEERNGARDRDSLLSDAFEAVLAALRLDGGLDVARSFLLPFIEQAVDDIAAGGGPSDFKTRLQELCQGRFGVTPRYHTVGVSGPDHQRTFEVEVHLGDDMLGSGSGPSKQAAAMAAAEQALQRLDQDEAASGS